MVGKNVEVVTKYLKSLDEFFNVAVEFNGVEALSKLTSKAWNYFDVIVCSIDLPMMDGFEFCELATKYTEGSQLMSLV